ncbi:VTT domain-containing protein [Streptomyces sp. NPDC005925]|uniref:DedA family protein n=1 Tax=Streptomyces sp. NPDC005925 TaxID=3157172 RepID=UPI00340E8165
MTTLALGPEWLSPDYLISTFSLPGILLIVFAESGLFAFLPGDSLLFTAGLFVAQGEYISQPLWLVCLLIVLAAVIGDQVGYMIGKFFGPKLFNRPNSKLFKQENLDKAHEFMEKYGPKAIVLARFVPIVRTFGPIVAGAGRMQYRTFLTYNVIGGAAWGSGVTLAGYWLGQIELIRTHVETILVLIVLLSVVPILIEYLRERGKNKRAAAEAPPTAAPHRADRQPPVMDDATTQLRAVPPAHQDPYAQQDPYGRQDPYAQQDSYGRQDPYGQQHPQQQPHQHRPQQPQHPQPQHPQPQHPHPYDQQSHGRPYDEQQYYGRQPQAQPQQQPYAPPYPQGQGQGGQNGPYPYNEGY